MFVFFSVSIYLIIYVVSAFKKLAFFKNSAAFVKLYSRFSSPTYFIFGAETLICYITKLFYVYVYTSLCMLKKIVDSKLYCKD